MTECPKKGPWSFSETIHDWDNWKTVSEGHEDCNNAFFAWRQYWIKQTRTCKVCGKVEMDAVSKTVSRS